MSYLNIDAERDRLMGLAEKATLGPWYYAGCNTVHDAAGDEVAHPCDMRNDSATAKFIAAAHSMVALIRAQADEIERLHDDANIALASHRKDVIEECAKVIDRRCEILTLAYNTAKSSHAEGRMDEADSCASAIRALKEREAG